MSRQPRYRDESSTLNSPQHTPCPASRVSAESRLTFPPPPRAPDRDLLSAVTSALIRDNLRFSYSTYGGSVHGVPP